MVCLPLGLSWLLYPSTFLFFFITCLCSCLLGPPASQGAPLLECRCCHCHTCTTHRPSFLPLHSVSPGIQVLLFPFLYQNVWSLRICFNTKTRPPLFLCFRCDQSATKHIFFGYYFCLFFFLPPHLCFNPECFPRLDTWLSSILMSHYRFGLFVESLIHSEKRGFPGVVGTCVLCRRRYEVPVSVCKPYGPGCEMVKMSVSIFSDVI